MDELLKMGKLVNDLQNLPSLDNDIQKQKLKSELEKFATCLLRKYVL